MKEVKDGNKSLLEFAKLLVVVRKEKWPNEPLTFMKNRTGLSLGTLNRFERGEILTPPTDEILDKICNGYEISKEIAREFIYPVIKSENNRSEDFFVKVPILSVEMFLDVMLNRSKVPEGSDIRWTVFSKTEDYHCATKLGCSDYEPEFDREDIIIVKQCSEVCSGDIVVLASEDFKSIELKIFSEQELKMSYLRSINPSRGQKDLEFNIETKKRLLGIVALSQRQYS